MQASGSAQGIPPKKKPLKKRLILQPGNPFARNVQQQGERSVPVTLNIEKGGTMLMLLYEL
jgi:hypothetical protein